MATAGAESAVYDCIVVNATDRRGSGGVAIWHAVALPVLCAQTVTWRRVDNDTASDVTASSCAVLAPLLRRIGCGGNRQKVGYRSTSRDARSEACSALKCSDLMQHLLASLPVAHTMKRNRFHRNQNLRPDSQNIVRHFYDNLTTMPKLRSTYDGRLIYKTSEVGCRAFLAPLTLTTGLPDLPYFTGDPVFQPRSPAFRKEAARETESPVLTIDRYR